MHPLMTHPMYGWLRQKPAVDVWWEPNPELADALVSLYLHNERGGDPCNLVDGYTPALTGTGWTWVDGPQVGLAHNSSTTTYYLPAPNITGTSYTMFGWATAASGVFQEFIDDDDSGAPDRHFQFRLTDTNKVDFLAFNTAGSVVDNVFSGAALGAHQLAEGFTLGARQAATGALSVWQDGIKGSDSTLTGTLKTVSSGLMRVGVSRAGVFPWQGTIFLWAAWNGDPGDPVMEALADYPALLLRPVAKRIYAPILSTGATLTVADAAISLTTDSPALTQVHSLTVSDGAIALTTDSPALTQVHSLAIADAAVALTVDNVVLNVSGTLLVDDATLALTADNLALTSGTLLAIQDAVAGLSVGAPALTQVHVLVVQDATAALVADAVGLLLPGQDTGPRILVIGRESRVLVLVPESRLLYH